MILICYEKCTTCQKARRFLQENGADFTERPIREQNPTAEELRAWQQKSGLPLRRFFNTSGLQYRALGLREKLTQMTEEQQLELLAADGMLVKRPLLVTEEKVLVGFRESEWKALLQEGRA